MPIDEDMVKRVIRGTVTSTHAQGLIELVRPEKIKTVIYDLGRHKAHGLDGYTAEFFRTSWETVGGHVTTTGTNIFEHERLLLEANNTIISLVPKKANPTMLLDFRQISCCNTVYKRISRLLASWI